MKVKIIAHTPNPEEVIAQAAKLCYSPVGVDEIMEKLTPEKVEKFISHLADIGHESPFEHVTFTFAIEGISRCCTHQQVRHRIASYSQQKKKNIKQEQIKYKKKKEKKKIPEAKKIFIETMEKDQKAYNELVKLLMKEKIPKDDMLSKQQYNAIEKQAIEDARYVFPNACETKIVVTMNVRSLLHFFNVRCCNRAQWEIRQMADEMLKECRKVAPKLFKNAGPDCTFGKCGEGNMSCGKPRKPEDFK